MKSIKYLLPICCVFLMVGFTQAQSIMDLKIAYDAQSDSALVTWYPEVTEGAAGYVVNAYNTDGTLLLEHTISFTETMVTIADVNVSGIAEVSIVSFDSTGLAIEMTLTEEVITPVVPQAMMSTQSTSPCGLGITLESFDTGAFPMLYAAVKVTSNGIPVGTFTSSDFEAFENNILQTELFHVTPPEQGGGVRIADIVFLIDTSGSMGDEIAAVRNNVINFANALTASSVDYNLGLVQFGNGAGSNPRIVGSGLTPDAEQFKAWVGSLYASGGVEPGYEAINLAIQNFNFRTGAQKIFILISDEDSDGSLANTVNWVLANQVTVYTAVNPSAGNTYAHYSGPAGISAVSGGKTYLVTYDLSSIIIDIGTLIKNAYIIRYKSSNPACDGTTRNVELVVTSPNDPSCSATATTSYTSCGAPVIIRTPDTIALHDNPHLVGATLLIAAEVRDYVAPFTQGVTLFVKTTGTANWTQLSMLPIGGGNVYAANIPTVLVQQPGVDYYIRATDGEVTSANPANGPALNPHQLAVYPNIAPVITHTPPSQAMLHTALDLVIGAEDQTDGLSELALYYRVTGELLYKEVSLVYAPIVGQTTETITITQSNVEAPSIEYYIRATDNYGVSSYWFGATPDNPYILPVTENINRAPEAVCQDVVVETDPGVCYAHVSIDAGSYDPDGDPIAIAQIPAGPYPLGTTEVTLIVTDDGGLTAQCTATVTVEDWTPPEIHSIWATPLVGAINQTISFSANVSDICDNDVDVVWNYDDNSGTTPDANHAYADSGVYNVSIMATDDAGNAATGTIMVVIYDPSGKFITGGGWIDSPAGAFIPNQALTGEATFGFVSRYKRGKSIPTGNTEFQFLAAGLDFHSSSYDWLVINRDNDNAQYKGVGTINGEGAYRFMIWAGDSAVDTFRIRIWEEDESGLETDIYDNGVEQAIGGGSIVIHEKKEK